jgi:hypothetical protein
LLGKLDGFTFWDAEVDEVFRFHDD